MAKPLQDIKLRLFLFGVILGSAALIAAPAFADDDVPNPFSIDSSHWITFDHYKEKVAHPQAKAPAPEAPPTPEQAAAAQIPDGTTTDSTSAEPKKEPEKKYPSPAM